MANWLWPVQDHGVGTGFGVSGSQWASGQHTGVDFDTAGGSPVQAASGGKVGLARSESYGSPYGNYVIVDHGNGVYTLYAHLAGFNVRVGQELKAGQHIGQVGSTGTNSSGPHLHFEVRKGSGWMYPSAAVNPVAFLNNHGVEGGTGGGGGNNGRENGGGGGGNDGAHRSDFGFSPQFLDDHPEIDRLVQEAIRKEWSVTRFQAELKQTAWWKHHDQAQRNYQTLLSEDPAQAKDLVQDNRATIKALATQLGVDLSDREVDDLAEKAARNAWTSTEIQMAVGREFSMKQKGPLTGVASQTVYDLRQMAYDQGLPIGRKRLGRWTEDILQGKTTVEGFESQLREQAKNLYPHLAEQIDRAGSLRAWADPYLQLASQTLGINADTVRLDKGKFASLLTPTKGDDGKRPPSLDEWATTLRTDEKFGFDRTAGAQEAASDLTAQLGRMFGVA